MSKKVHRDAEIFSSGGRDERRGYPRTISPVVKNDDLSERMYYAI